MGVCRRVVRPLMGDKRVAEGNRRRGMEKDGSVD